MFYLARYSIACLAWNVIESDRFFRLKISASATTVHKNLSPLLSFANLSSAHELTLAIAVLDR